MGTCRYCRKPAGLLRDYHGECQKAYDAGKKRICFFVREAMTGASTNEIIEDEVSRFANQWNLDMPDMRPILVEGWNRALDAALEDGVITQDEEKALVHLQEFFDLQQDDLNASGAYTKLVKSCVLREVMHGNIPTAFQPQGRIPFNIQKGEKIVWGFQPVEYWEMRDRTTYVGGYAGASVRVAKGLYLRTGGFRGVPQVTTHTLPVDSGILLVTDKHIYFTGHAKSFRIPYKKIVSFQPFSDGVGLCRDAASAKPQLFKTGDGWFTYNLLTNLAQTE